MFKRILLTTDLSAASDAVINCMEDFKTLGVEEITLFYACGVRHLVALAEVIKESVEPYLISQQKKLESQGFKTVVKIAPGIPYEEIKKVAQQKDISLIVIGSQGQSAFNHIMERLGGVASDILHSHEKPLLLIRTRVTEKDGIQKVEALCKNLKNRILFATDFSDISLQAFKYVEAMVEDGCKKVTLMHVQDKVRIEKHLYNKLDDFNNEDSFRLERLKEQLLMKGAEDVDIKIPYGIPSKEILDEAMNDYTLIIMGSQGRGFFQEIFIGSVSHNVAKNANVSLLLIPSVLR